MNRAVGSLSLKYKFPNVICHKLKKKKEMTSRVMLDLYTYDDRGPEIRNDAVLNGCKLRLLRRDNVRSTLQANG